MPRSNKTSSVLRLIGAETAQSENKVSGKSGTSSKLKNNPGFNGAAGFSAPEANTEAAAKKKRRPRKNITKNLELKKLVAEAPHNPAFKKTSSEERVYFRRQGSEKLIINVSSYLINEQLGSALERFRSCSCDTCCRVITETATAMMPDSFIRINGKADEEEAWRAVEELRPEAIRVLTKICITARGKPYHERD